MGLIGGAFAVAAGLLVAAVRTGKAAHVLYNAGNGHLEHVAEGDRFAHISEGHVLRRGDHNGAVGLLKELAH